MYRTLLAASAASLILSLVARDAEAQHGGQPVLHVDPRWRECSFRLDRALTQGAWRQFTREAGLVTYFRPLVDARPMGRGHVEVSMLQWETAIDDHDAAWNDTFVHPDSAHWLFEGSGLRFPGLSVRAGVSSKIDVGGYVTRNPNANYGFYGAQVQYNVVQDTSRHWAVSTRASVVSLYGPDDLDFTVAGLDAVASRSYAPASWAEVSPYVGASAYLARSHETSAAVALADERVLGVQATAGLAVRLSKLTLAAEYNSAQVRSRSLKVGLAF